MFIPVAFPVFCFVTEGGAALTQLL